eukprot:gnl/Spiro4/21514_TR10541_c0_g1_i1.p1 gnl/Spiro4/21514_TR10541_c0_g1~~gnl/Spiro4/21514_TR10541_c0_g1_i1.p1  ORF type:complete len:273 (-),score=25.91 gnl/Spiro4/21514_TR10541_c0_g1_i1:467-1285(-)
MSQQDSHLSLIRQVNAAHRHNIEEALNVLNGLARELEPPHFQVVLFGGCGGMYNYFLGVASVMQRYFDLSNTIFCGVSAGCFPAASLGLGIDIKSGFQSWNLPLLREVREKTLGAFMCWNEVVRRHTLEQFPSDSHTRLADRLHISLTRLPFLQHETVSIWSDTADLVDCMMTSGYVPVFSNVLAPLKRYRDKSYIDGGVGRHSYDPRIAHLPRLELQKDMWRPVKLSWFWCWTDEDWAQTQFDWGTEDAVAHLDELAKILPRKQPDDFDGE